MAIAPGPAVSQPPLTLLMLGFAVVSAADTVACSSRESCDKALEIVCACASRPCDRDDPPEVVARLRRCGNSKDGDYAGNLDMCIADAPGEYCAILDSMYGVSTNICSLDCTTEGSCDLREQCLQHQWDYCGEVPADAGSDD